MDQFLSALALNQLVVIILAALVWIVAKWEWITNRPALVHGLWMLLHVKCVTPPLVDLPMLPRIVPRNFPTRQREDVDSKKVLTPSDSPPLLNDSGRAHVCPPQSGALPVTFARRNRLRSTTRNARCWNSLRASV